MIAIFARIAAALGLNDQADAAAYAAPTYAPQPTTDTGEQDDLDTVARVTEAQLRDRLSELAFGRER